MALTIEWLLNQTIVPGFVLIAGEEPFLQKIYGTNIIDNPNTVPWLSPGTLVISSGYLLSRDELSGDIIQQLQQKGCAGLAIKMNRYLDKLSPEMMLQARELHFPIISIPFTCNFEQVISLIYRNLFDEEMNDTRRLISAYQEISDCVLKEKSMPQVLGIIGNFFQCNAYLTNPSYEIIDFTVYNDSPVPFLFPHGKNAYTLFSETDIQYLKENYSNYPFPLKTYTIDVNSGTLNFHILPITNQEYLQGFLLLQNVPLTESSSLYTFLSNLRSILSIGMLNQSVYIETRLTNKEMFFQKILAKEPDSLSEAEALCTKNQFNYNTDRICIIFNLERYAQLPFIRRRPEEHRIIEFVKLLLKEYSIDYQYTFYQDQLVLFLFAGNPLTHENYMTLGMEIAEKLSQILTDQGFPAHAGISSDSYGVMTICTSYQQARQALEIGPQLRPDNRCFSYFQDRIYYELMNHFTFRELHAIYAVHLELLDQYDRENHTEYLSALQTYLRCGCSISQTARNLYVHRNTLSYWLEQIRSILGMNLKSQDDLLALQIAFYARRILNNNMKTGTTES